MALLRDFLAEKIHSGEIEVYPIITIVALVKKVSKTAARNLIKGGAVEVNEKKTTDTEWICLDGDDIRIGKGAFYKI